MADTQQEEPLFDPSLKKKKGLKKTVDFSGLDGDDGNDAAAAPGTSQDPDAAPAAQADEDDMFGGLKKKKKSKNAIPMDLELVSMEHDCIQDDHMPALTLSCIIPQDQGDSAAAKVAEPASEAGAAAAENTEDGDLDFGEMKKKKKKSKKANFDMEAFEKELGQGGGDGEGGEDGAGATTAADEDAEGDLGDDPFAKDDGDDQAGGAKEQVETWHGTDRDYAYQEVSGRVACQWFECII